MSIFSLALVTPQLWTAPTPDPCDSRVGEVIARSDSVFVIRIREDEGHSLVLCFRTAQGLRTEGPFAGELLFLPRTRTAVVVGLSAHDLVRETRIYDFSGDLIELIRHGELGEYGASEDGKIFWVAEAYMVAGVPERRVHVYTHGGRELLTDVYRSAATVRVELEGRAYLVHLKPPAIPG